MTQYQYSEFLVCFKCYKVFGGKVRPCQNCGNELIAIDENLAPMIIKLNKLGYITWACCSSHLYGCTGGYIIFANKYDLPEINIEYFKLGLFNGNSEIRWVNKKWHEHNSGDFEIIENLHHMMSELNKYVNNLKVI